jgi:U3 small nucleolar ribonucleoprotein protein IMP4
MLRRRVRERKEYLFRKSLEGDEREKYEKKRQIRKALEEGTPLAPGLRHEAESLKAEMDHEDVRTARLALRSHMDDEYESAGVSDPSVFITTSRDPSQKLLQFTKELALIIPNAQRKLRGGHVVKELVDAARANEVTDLIIVHETRGVPDALIVCHLPYGPTAYFGLSNVVTRHDVDHKMPVSGVHPHLIFDNFTTPLGERVQNILKFLFPPAKDDGKRTLTFSNSDDFISFRHHVWDRIGGEVILKEVGPRFEMRLFQLKLGTVDQGDADNEWVYRPFINTAKRKTYLGDPYPTPTATS